MPETEPRFHVVALLCSSDFKRRSDTNTWSYLDGRPFTKEEQAIVDTATHADLQETRAQIARYQEYLRTMSEARDTLHRYLAPFMDRLMRKTLSGAVKIMTKDDRAELDRLLADVADPIRPFTPYAF
ncbi:hypothetical protein [Streptomyces flavofungini]|uniref:hypothetical protein n=1 Tax=Streptomyces flavofungini TaxID=68200 RepID=UPI0025AF09F8|nr:hypothetical protein [Streptomyces flavofungini]WJV47149.1 hypothetical protein QUY26_17455 [Streptomyces flavofungini]